MIDKCLSFMEFREVSEKGNNYVITQMNYRKAYRSKSFREVLAWVGELIRLPEKVTLKGQH